MNSVVGSRRSTIECLRWGKESGGIEVRLARVSRRASHNSPASQMSLQLFTPNPAGVNTYVAPESVSYVSIISHFFPFDCRSIFWRKYLPSTRPELSGPSGVGGLRIGSSTVRIWVLGKTLSDKCAPRLSNSWPKGSIDLAIQDNRIGGPSRPSRLQ